VDETVLILLTKRQKKVSAKIYTQKISEQLKLDVAKHNAQYEPVNIYESKTFHDRFLLIDDTVFHIGASLKDLGKKLFAFSKMEIKSTEILKNIKFGIGRKKMNISISTFIFYLNLLFSSSLLLSILRD
jgi:hypothetical protein